MYKEQIVSDVSKICSYSIIKLSKYLNTRAFNFTKITKFWCMVTNSPLIKKEKIQRFIHFVSNENILVYVNSVQIIQTLTNSYHKLLSEFCINIE